MTQTEKLLIEVLQQLSYQTKRNIHYIPKPNLTLTDAQSNAKLIASLIEEPVTLQFKGDVYLCDNNSCIKFRAKT